MDAIEQFKTNQKAAWANFAMLENVTSTAAPHLVRFAGIRGGSKVLDVACGTGVVALTAARTGANVQGLDLTPELVQRARENATLTHQEVSFQEGDVENLPFPAATFDVVVSQFGHIFAPRPEVAIAEMVRVLKPGGTIAFSTWPPELFTGRWFELVGRYMPAPPLPVPPPQLWGDPAVVRERLGSAVRDIEFNRATMFFQTPSPEHYCFHMIENFGPAKKLFAQLDANAPEKAAELRSQIEALVRVYFEPEQNQLRQDFLVTRATKV